MSKQLSDVQFNKLCDLLKKCENKGISLPVRHQIAIELLNCEDFDSRIVKYTDLVNQGYISQKTEENPVVDKEKKIQFVSVAFKSGEKLYCYRADDDSLKVGDRVIVPTGCYGDINTAKIVRIEYCSAKDAPFPINKIKSIIGKADPIPPEHATGASLFEIVKTVVDEDDCEGLLRMGCPSDEYDGESERITNNITQTMDEYQIASVMAEVMTKSFGSPYSSDSFLDAATVIRAWMTLENEATDAKTDEYKGSDKASPDEIQNPKDKKTG